MVGHDGMQSDMVLEKMLRVLHLGPKAARSELKTLDLAWAFMRPQIPPLHDILLLVRPHLLIERHSLRVYGGHYILIIIAFMCF